jgi:hypothetical protein
LEEGAIATLKNKQGLDALDFARLGSRPDAVAILGAAIRQAQPTSGGPPQPRR